MASNEAQERSGAPGGSTPLRAHGLRSLYITVRDGTRLAVDLYGTDAAHPRPLILVATQYRRRAMREGELVSMVDQVAVLQRLADDGELPEAAERLGAVHQASLTRSLPV